MDARRDEQRDTIIAALMTAEEMYYLEAANFVAGFEQTVRCPRCGAVIDDRDASELSGTIWDGWMSRSA